MKLTGRQIRRTRGRAQLGFTLAEVMTGVAIVGIAFAALYAGMASGFMLTRSSRENLRATQIMLERMEGIRLHNWNQVTASNMISPTFSTHYYPESMGSDTNSQGVLYIGNVTIGTPAISPAPTYIDKLRQIDVELRWNSGDVTRTRQMSTIVGRDGVQNYIYNN